MSENIYDQMREKYPEFMESTERLKLDASRVPQILRRYIPYAELWGVSDDLDRETLVDRAPMEAKADVSRVVEEIDDLLDDWLAGPEAEVESPSQEYVAFSAMRMAVDFM